MVSTTGAVIGIEACSLAMRVRKVALSNAFSGARVIAPAGGETGVLVTEKDDSCSGILSVLRERLGFTAIYSMRKGTLWLLAFERQDKAQAREIAERLLCSRHYQQYEVV